MKYKYLFRFGRGKQASDLFGTSIADIYSETYDLFDICKELRVEKLDRTSFTNREIRKIAKELFEDMDEDCYLINTEIAGKKLRFCSLGTNMGSELDELQQLVRLHPETSGKTATVNIQPGMRELFIESGEKDKIGVLVSEYKRTIDKTVIQVFKSDCEKRKIRKRMIVASEIEKDAEKCARDLRIRIREPDQLRKEINESLLGRALDRRKL